MLFQVRALLDMPHCRCELYKEGDMRYSPRLQRPLLAKRQLDMRFKRLLHTPVHVVHNHVVHNYYKLVNDHVNHAPWG